MDNQTHALNLKIEADKIIANGNADSARVNEIVTELAMMIEDNRSPHVVRPILRKLVRSL